MAVRLVPARDAVGQEGDLYFALQSGRRGELAFFHTYAGAAKRNALDKQLDRILNLRIPYRVLNVEVAWNTRPGAPSAAEKASLNGCIKRAAK